MAKITGKASDIVPFLMNADRETVWDLCEHKERRSLSQNAYYWALIGKLAQKTSISSAAIHNQNLRDLGLVLRVNDELVPVYIPDTDEAERAVLEAETYHIKPTSKTKEGKDGKLYRCYVMLRGSSSFTTDEMAGLLNLLIQEAKAQGIETLTPDELARMREAEKNAQAYKGHGHKAGGSKNS